MMIEVKEVLLYGKLEYIVVVDGVDNPPVDKKHYAIMEAKKNARALGVTKITYRDSNNCIDEVEV